MDFNDDLYDKTRGLSIEISDELSKKIHSCGTKVLFDTRVPTKDELRGCQHITMASIILWEPSEVKIQ